MYSRISDYDDYSTAYAAYVAQREHGGVEDDHLGILPCLLKFLETWPDARFWTPAAVRGIWPGCWLGVVRASQGSTSRLV